MKEIWWLAIILVSITLFSFTNSPQQVKKETLQINSQPLPPPLPITLIATGDIMLGRKVNTQTLKYNDFKWVFLKTADVLSSADITFINLEGPLVEKCSPTMDGMIFCGDTRHIEGLKYAGVDIANLANNHASNYGKDGIKTTSELLRGAGIAVTGINDPVIKDIKGTRFAFLGFSDFPDIVIQLADKKLIEEKVKLAKQTSDIVVVQFHWGIEYQTQPSIRQIELAHLAIESGADLVIGNHPHWIQPVEIYKNKTIVYSHGNFVFDQEWSQKTKEGIVGKYSFVNNKLTNVEFLPVLIENFGQPRFLEGNAKEKILQDLKLQSEILAKHLNEKTN